MTRWLILLLGLGLAGAAFFALLCEPQPLDRIDDASRAELERVLRATDAEGSGR